MNLLKRVYHLIIKRDIVSKFYTNKFGGFGKNSVLYKPLYIKNKKDIYIKENTTILNNVRMQVYNDITKLDSKILIGKKCYIGYNASFLAGGNIIIEDGVLLASNILLSSENHSINPECEEYYMEQPLISKDIIIKEGCWIGENAKILPGVTIGKKSVIGAGSIVTTEKPNYCIAVVAPAKVIKKYNFKTHRWECIEGEKNDLC